MAYPSKINRPAVTEAALALLEREGEDALTLRRLAAEVGVTANALYRYFESRDVLVAASADAIGHRLHTIIENAIAELPTDVTVEHRVRTLLVVYSNFAQNNPALYRTFIGANNEAGADPSGPHYRDMLWHQSLAIVQPLVGAEDGPAATVAMWGLLHGLWALRQAGVLGGKKPAEIDDYAFDAIIRGLER